ncbi:exosome component 3 [Corchorus olitorius]|uniref:Exosome component 3 n=1 Tax=Corchorus olitorius TaxID=93759 RepID=A0A1R3KV11_9ROSI|nr:exosome component 3 [Corchorus olitorius]
MPGGLAEPSTHSRGAIVASSSLVREESRSTIGIKLHYPIIGWYPSHKEFLISVRLSGDEVLHYLTSRMNDIGYKRPFLQGYITISN